MTAPIWKAKEAYEKLDCGWSWSEMLNAHLAQGYCVSTPDYFICARPVDKDAHKCEIEDPNFEFHLQHCNAWFIYMVAGDALPSLWTVCPHNLPWVMFYRCDDRCRTYSNDRIRRLSNGRLKTKTTTTTSANCHTK